MSKKNRQPAISLAGLSGLFDAHTHLFSHPADDGDLVDRAASAGVARMVTVGDDLAESRGALAAARAHKNVWAACAVHPVRAGELDADVRVELAELAADPCCVAVGETGLDAYWIQHEPDTTASLEVQEEALRWHMDLALKVKKTLMIHNREADADVLRVLDGYGGRVMLHCFSSPLEVAREALERGWILSFAGNVTFKRNDELRQAARFAPAGQLLIETDAPYMTPEPFRGRRNEPALIGHTWECVARVRGVSVATLVEELTPTFNRTFGL